MSARRLHLASLLASHIAEDAVEAEHLGRFRALLEEPGDVFARDHFVPGHVTASAFVLSPDGTDLLLIHHGKLHRWLQPGGHVDPDDVDVVAAARREVEEEVGLTGLDLVHEGVFDLDVHDIPAIKGDPSHAHFDVRILLRAPHRDAVAGSDAQAVRWVPLGDVNEAESDESVMRAVRKLVARL
jgi:8-oxo-dGTP pyrophosphatase MutT (NUDIX family)